MGTSLIPIKGISQAQKKSLKSSCGISDIAGLLAGGRTPEQRQAIADKLGIDRRYVDIWVKQAALWDVEGMTEDFAYLLIVAGVRSSLDLAKIDVGATRIALKAASNAHPDHQYDEAALAALKSAAERISAGAGAGVVVPVFDENDPEPAHLFAGSGIGAFAGSAGFGGVTKITVAVTFANGQTYENTTTFPAVQGDVSGVAAGSGGGERPSGRVDHPGMTGGSGSTGAGSASSGTGRVDHPGMTGDSGSTGSTSSGTGSGSTGRRR